jgi:hypothetical protein
MRKKTDCSMTSCTKTGIKIKHSANEYTADPFAGVNPFKGESDNKVKIDYAYESLDLNIDNYSIDELYKLFGFKKSIVLTEENIKEAKKIVLKTHPDKSRLEDKYFIFFGKAYKKLLTIYEFHNKSNTKKAAVEDFQNEEQTNTLNKLFDVKKDLKSPDKFNEWFNSQFEKHQLEDKTENGHGDWLKSDEDIVFTPKNISKDSMGREMDKRKKIIQAMTPYTGFKDSFYTCSAGGSSLMNYDSNFSSGSVFSGCGTNFADLRQAYAESVIPVTEDDFNKVPTFKSVDEYKRHRDTTNIVPLTKEEAMRQLYAQDAKANEESAALAFYYAQQSEKSKKNNELFWAGLQQITN